MGDCDEIPSKSEIYRLRMANEWAGCSQLCSEYLRANPTDAQVLRMKVECQISLHQLEEAKATLMKLAKYLPEKELWFLQANIEVQAHDWKKAKELVDRCWEKDGKSFYSVVWQRANIYSNLGDHREAIETLKYMPNQRSLEFLLTHEKRGSALDATIALKDLYKGGWREEVLWLLKDYTPEQLPDEIVRLWAMVAQNCHKYELAVSLLRYILKTDKVYREQHGLDAISNLMFMNHFADALTELDRVQPLYSSNAKFWLMRSKALKQLDRVDEAAQSLEQGLRVDPKCAELYYQRSEIEKGFKRMSESLSDLNKAIELDPNNRAFIETRIFREIGRPEESHVIGDFDKLISLVKPADKAAYMIRKAAYLSRRGDLVNAVKILDECLHDAPKERRALSLMQTYCAELKRNKIPCAECAAHGF